MSILKAHHYANYKILFLFTGRKIKTNHLPPAQKEEGCPKKTSPVVENQKEYILCVSCLSNSQLVDPLLLCKKSRAICLWSTHVPIVQEGSEGNQSPGHCDKCLDLLQKECWGINKTPFHFPSFSHSFKITAKHLKNKSGLQRDFVAHSQSATTIKDLFDFPSGYNAHPSLFKPYLAQVPCFLLSALLGLIIYSKKHLTFASSS